MKTSGLQVVAGMIQEGKGEVRGTGIMGDNPRAIELVIGITRETTNAGQNVTLEATTNDDANASGKEIGSAMTLETGRRGNREGSGVPPLLTLAPQDTRRHVHVPAP
jgi:hypothetical protein